MLNNNYKTLTYLWLDVVDPDTDVHNSLSYTADNGDIFLNMDTFNLFFCAYGGANPQDWRKIAYSADISTAIAAIPQSNWNQSNVSASDYIKNKPAARSQTSATRALNTAFQVSTTRESLVNYSVDIATSLSLVTGQSGTVFLEIASDSGFTANVQELCRFVNGQTGTLTIGLALTQNVTGNLNGFVPANYFVRMRTANTTGTPSFTFRSGQEILL